MQKMWVANEKNDNSTLKNHATKNYPFYKDQVNMDQQNIIPDSAIFIYNNDVIQESFCKCMIQ